MDVPSLNREEVIHPEVTAGLESLSAGEILEWALDKFSPRIALACSFQAEGSVLIDMMHRRRGSDFRIFTLDTGRLNQETYDCMDAIRARYGVSVEVYFPDAIKVQEMVREQGLNLFYKSIELRQLCCGIRKVEPLKRALSDLSAWVTGLRRDQAVTRAEARKVELDREHANRVKVNPLADWSHDQVWDYIRQNDVPYNRLYDQGYSSIGCAPCTRAVKRVEDLRAGRWWWENPETKECGVHVNLSGKLERNEEGHNPTDMANDELSKREDLSTDNVRIRQRPSRLGH
jgi:phosphoadenosine phosphosulfate reductase